jgi:GDP/UDP-N,N'-diacetylbacillosamine 2-epimerase (hydrolysing)
MNKICVITSTRADYGLLYWTLKELKASNFCQLQLVVTGMHLSSKFGNTYKLIEKDGFNIDAKVDLGQLNSTRGSILDQISLGVRGFTDTITKLSPDLIIILGDRYEMLAAAQVALILGIPIAHIHGGEVTEGAFDDSIRHAITKMSHLHFTSTEIYRNRVIQMGESPGHVFNVGAPGLERIRKIKTLTNKELEESLGFKLREKNLLITYHPVTAKGENAMGSLIGALEKMPDVGQIITLPNSDPEHDIIFEQWSRYSQGKENVFLSSSLGSLNYINTMKVCDAVVGNSSSGVIEAPFCATPTVNLGSRQKGRILTGTVIQVDNLSVDEIYKSIKKAIGMKVEQELLYGDGFSASKIIKILKDRLEEGFEVKSFYDLENGYHCE